jgi:hypothetical protein
MKLRLVFSRALLAGCQETLVALLPGREGMLRYLESRARAKEGAEERANGEIVKWKGCQSQSNCLSQLAG